MSVSVCVYSLVFSHFSVAIPLTTITLIKPIVSELIINSFQEKNAKHTLIQASYCKALLVFVVLYGSYLDILNLKLSLLNKLKAESIYS